MNKTTTWWDRASRDERIAQIDAAVELEVPVRVLARNLGTTPQEIARFANATGRTVKYFRPSNGAANKRRAVTRRLKDAFLRGEPVDFWQPA